VTARLRGRDGECEVRILREMVFAEKVELLWLLRRRDLGLSLIRLRFAGG